MRGRGTFAIAVAGVLLASAGTSAAQAAQVGSFAVSCAFAQSAVSDPIVSPGRKAAHEHVFFGSTAPVTDLGADLAALRAAPTTCLRRGAASPEGGDFSAYWAPSAIEVPEAGRTATDAPRVSMSSASVYYFGPPKRPAGFKRAETIRAFPEGLKLIAGDAAAAQVEDADPHLSVGCFGGNTRERAADHAISCPAGSKPGHSALSVVVEFPSCWDGGTPFAFARRDQRDSLLVRRDGRERAHVRYPVRSGQALGCFDPDYPITIPKVHLRLTYLTLPDRWYTFSSGPWFRMHADFFNGWRPEDVDGLVESCLKTYATCGRDSEPDPLLGLGGSPLKAAQADNDRFAKAAPRAGRARASSRRGLCRLEPHPRA